MQTMQLIFLFSTPYFAFVLPHIEVVQFFLTVRIVYSTPTALSLKALQHRMEVEHISTARHLLDIFVLLSTAKLSFAEAQLIKTKIQMVEDLCIQLTPKLLVQATVFSSPINQIRMVEVSSFMYGRTFPSVLSLFVSFIIIIPQRDLMH